MNQRRKVTRLRDIGELELIKRIRKFFPTRRDVIRGIGDDAAVLPCTREEYLLFTVDTLVEGIDFQFKKDNPEEVGRKALAINLSDIAAMGGIPLYGVVSLGLPPQLEFEFIRKFYRGIKKLARQWKVSVVGGDVSRSKVFFSSITLLGGIEKKYLALRSGAKSGDWIFVTGNLGGSILRKHLSFTPRIKESRFLVENFKIHSMIDISDGLIQDLSHILQESRKGARIFLDRLPISKEAFLVARKDRRSALRHALSDGEDFELLFTVSEREGKRILSLKGGLNGTRVSWIGEISSKQGLFFHSDEEDTKGIKLRWKGYEHF